MRDLSPFGTAESPTPTGWRGYTHGSGDQPGMEALRQQIEQKIDAVRADIEERIAELKRAQHETELADQIGQLENQLSFLDAQMMSANTATLASLIAIQTALPRAMSAAVASMSHTMAHASAEGAHHIVEMTSDKIAAMDRVYAAEAAQFRAYEQRSFARMEQLAEANGVESPPTARHGRRFRRTMSAPRRAATRLAWPLPITGWPSIIWLGSGLLGPRPKKVSATWMKRPAPVCACNSRSRKPLLQRAARKASRVLIYGPMSIQRPPLG